MTRWAILTGEYPPSPGGVSDYTRLVAEGLTATGDSVHVYSSAINTPDIPSSVVVCRLTGDFGLHGLRRMRESLAALRPDRILLQYVPHAFGWKGMNVAMVAELCRAARYIAPLSVMFHEVMFPIERGQPWRHALLARTNRWMASRLATAARQVYVSVPIWIPILADIAPNAPPPVWSPIVSNIPAETDPEKVVAVRRSLGESDSQWIGHFGTLGQGHGELLLETLRLLLNRTPQRRVLLIGRDGPAFLRHIETRYPAWSGLVKATGDLSATDVAAHIAACDVLLQSYLDGITSRRGSALACLALGVPLISNHGASTEEFWSDQILALAASPDAGQLAAKAEEFLSKPTLRHATAAAGREFYHRTFGIRRILADLRGESREFLDPIPSPPALDHVHDG